MKYKLRKVTDQGPKYGIFKKLYLNWFVPTWARIAYYTLKPYSTSFSQYKIWTWDIIIDILNSYNQNFKGVYVLFVDRQLTEEDLWTILSETKNKHIIEIITTLLQNV